MGPEDDTEETWVKYLKESKSDSLYDILLYELISIKSFWGYDCFQDYGMKYNNLDNSCYVEYREIQ